MANDLVEQSSYTPAQLELIKSTVAKGATDDELKLFLYRCRNMGLDPLKPGQIYFLKYNPSSPGTIIVGIEGMRARAAATGKHRGTQRGITCDEKGKIIGAWAEVHREGWHHPAREEVILSEYNTGKAMWAKMPGQMVKKVAEVAALRMAFPDELGGIYSPEEMDQAEPVAVEPKVTLDALFKKVVPAEEESASGELQELAERVHDVAMRMGEKNPMRSERLMAQVNVALKDNDLVKMQRLYKVGSEVLEELKGEVNNG